MLSREKTIADVSSWANILDDLLRRIATLIGSPRHHIRMTAVCCSWRASVADQKINFPAACLMLREGGNCDNYYFYSISEEIFDKLDLPEIQRSRYWGSTLLFLQFIGVFSIVDTLLLQSRPGDLAWRTLSYDGDDDDDGFKFLIDDAIYFKGENLCMTCRDPYDDDDDYEYKGYTIFKLDMDTKSWGKIYSSGDKSLFLGNCCTFTVAAADYPGCKPNCIYSTEESIHVEGIDIYDVEKIGTKI
ncbi:hypothetical protein Goari_003639 [Gossypium aridum]|uniref:KIB1-4 beta-propeller domain-containing protein n=1 Tax=Gossypium aridum TaxID=34290 RepID=A0A7J8YDR0_GOSAI|nr:hypothetical protein [Gossypium aridum]